MSNLDFEITGQGPDIILLHSLLSDNTSFADLVDRLSSKRRLILVNMPGFGTSPPAAPLEGYASEILSLMDDLSLPQTTDIIGNGLGSFAALTMAIQGPGRFNRMVLLGGAIAFPEPGRETFRKMAEKALSEGMKPLTGQAMLRMFSPDYIAKNPEIVADREAVFNTIDAGVFAAACTALSKLDLSDDLGGVANKTLLVVGADDSATTPILGINLVNALQNGEINELAGAGHAPHIQVPDALIEVLTPFLDL